MKIVSCMFLPVLSQFLGFRLNITIVILIYLLFRLHFPIFWPIILFCFSFLFKHGHHINFLLLIVFLIEAVTLYFSSWNACVLLGVLIVLDAVFIYRVESIRMGLDQHTTLQCEVLEAFSVIYVAECGCQFGVENNAAFWSAKSICQGIECLLFRS